MASELRTEPVFDALKQPLSLVESDDRRRQIEAYLDTARVPLERAVYDLMSQLVEAIDEKVSERYRLRLAYRPGGLGLEIEEKVQDGESEQGDGTWSALEGDVEKITIRIPAELKDLATQAAARAGTSANSWFIKALARALRNAEAPSPPPFREERHGHHGRGGNRMTGWIGGDDR